MTMMKKRSDRILLGFILAIFALFTYGHFENKWKDQALRASLGTRDDPIVFMWSKIKPGMTRQEVRKIMRGYYRLVENPPTNTIGAPRTGLSSLDKRSLSVTMRKTE